MMMIVNKRYMEAKIKMKGAAHGALGIGIPTPPIHRKNMNEK
jgi:hypothetical protein